MEFGLGIAAGVDSGRDKLVHERAESSKMSLDGIPQERVQAGILELAGIQAVGFRSTYLLVSQNSIEF